MLTRLASLQPEPSGAEFQFERPEWVLFRSVETLSQKAGVPKFRLRRLVLKELTDNALDTGARVRVGQIDQDTYYVEDDGPGFAGSPEEIARLFSINRPLVSSKLWRKPTRGAMGNGLRVVAGAIDASGGALKVWTRNRLLVLTPQNDGGTAVVAADADFPVGTRIELAFGPALPDDPRALSWAEAAIQMADGGEVFGGRPSPHWYDADHFYMLLQAAGARPVRELIEQLDGCTGAKAGTITGAFKGTACNRLTHEEAIALLVKARAEARPVRPERLGSVGPMEFMPPSYAAVRDAVELGGREPKAKVPFVVEAWAHASRQRDDGVSIKVFVNRTPITGEVRAYKDKGDVSLFGCGLRARLELAAGRAGLDLVLNLTTPFCPITTDGKEPDFSPFAGQIFEAVRKAVGKARRAMPKSPTASERTTQKAIILDRLEEGVAKASGDGQYRFSQRQLFYAIRPFLIEELGREPTWEHFQGVITDYENEYGDIRGMYRDPRGTLYHPHLGTDLPLGTLAVEQYARPEWTFNKVLYIEKEGFFEALKEAKWPERHDCALMTSKGFSSRAARDLLDLLADTEEPLAVFCVHDADASGTMIYQSLQEETKARQRRRVEIVNLGLEPWEALGMDLQVEDVKDRERRAPVADYVSQHAPDHKDWTEWLQEHRVELNAMTTPQFLAWLDAKMHEHEGEKVVPPAPVVAAEMTRRLEQHVRQAIVERVLREARLDEQVQAAMGTLLVPTGDELVDSTKEWLGEHQDEHWTGFIDKTASDLSGGR